MKMLRSANLSALLFLKKKGLIMQKETIGEFIATVVFFAPLIWMMLGVLQ
jgi:hypothetical protein